MDKDTKHRATNTLPVALGGTKYSAESAALLKHCKLMTDATESKLRHEIDSLKQIVSNQMREIIKLSLEIGHLKRPTKR